MTVACPYESQHLGMAALAVNDNLGSALARFTSTEGGIDALLQLEHYRAGGIYDLDAVAAGGLVGLGRLTMSPEQHLHVMQLFQLLMGDGFQATVGQSVHFGSIVHNVAQAVQVPCLFKFFLCLADGCGHPKTESRPLINLNDGHVKWF